jgi:hypothetical protein
MNLRALFGIHAVVTFAAGVVLVVAPAAIPNTVGIHVEPSAYLLCYLLAAAEFGFSALSWAARTITDASALRVIVMACIVLHAASGVLEIYALAEGLNAAICVNVAVRAVIIALFINFGLKAAHPEEG